MKVFLFLMDGLGYHYLNKLKSDARPIQNVIPTITAPNWMSILTGKSPKIHKIRDNESVKSKKFKFNFSTTFDDGWKSSWFITDWKMFPKYLNNRPKNQTKITVTKRPLDALLDPKQSFKQFNVINTDMLDSTGHRYGWGSQPFREKVEKIETFLLQFKKYMDQFKEKYVIVITADHGGLNDNHEDPFMSKIRMVPLIVWTNDSAIKMPHINKTVGIRKWLQSLI